jgi:brefeldin A-inhibited guanine nucleotide-exchange protein
VQAKHEGASHRDVSTPRLGEARIGRKPDDFSERDLRSSPMRSKLLSLHLVLMILKSHADLFVNPLISIPSTTSMENTPFLQATKQYLCLSLSRNAVSPVNQVFELSVEIFWCMLKSMRAQMKVGRFRSVR